MLTYTVPRVGTGQATSLSGIPGLQDRTLIGPQPAAAQQLPSPRPKNANKLRATAEVIYLMAVVAPTVVTWPQISHATAPCKHPYIIIIIISSRRRQQQHGRRRGWRRYLEVRVGWPKPPNGRVHKRGEAMVVRFGRRTGHGHPAWERATNTGRERMDVVSGDPPHRSGAPALPPTLNQGCWLGRRGTHSRLIGTTSGPSQSDTVKDQPHYKC